jgi:hypothetical protein
MFSLQVLGAVAQLERALIAERTKGGRGPRVAAAGSAAILACAPGTLTPSARSAQAATPLTGTAFWPSWMHGCRPCGGCDPPNLGAMLCAS